MRSSFRHLGIIVLVQLALTACTDTPQPQQLAGFNACKSIMHADDDRGIQRIQISLANDLDNVDLLEKLSWAYIDKSRSSFDPGYLTLAEMTAECITSIEGKSSAANLIRGHVALSKHQFVEAENIARDLVNQRGHWTDYGLLGDALADQGQLNKAASAYQSMMDQRPGPQAYSRAAHLRWLTGDLDGAIEMMLLSVKSTSPRAIEPAAWAKVQLAEYLFQAGNTPSALRILETVLKELPDYAPALASKGIVLMAQGDTDSALPALVHAVENEPSPLHYWQLIEALNKKGDDKAASLAQTALNSIGRQEDPRSYALYLLANDKNASLALSLIQQEIKQRRDVFTLGALAWALHKNGDTERAWKLSQQSLVEGTQDARLFLHAGGIAQHLGYQEKAQQLLRKANQIQHMLMPSERQALANQLAQF